MLSRWQAQVSKTEMAGGPAVTLFSVTDVVGIQEILEIIPEFRRHDDVES